MTRPPEILYWVEVLDIGKLKYREKGGGKFTQKAAADARRVSLAKKGVTTRLLESEPIRWKGVGTDGVD